MKLFDDSSSSFKLWFGRVNTCAPTIMNVRKMHLLVQSSFLQKEELKKHDMFSENKGMIYCSLIPKSVTVPSYKFPFLFFFSILLLVLLVVKALRLKYETGISYPNWRSSLAMELGTNGTCDAYSSFRLDFSSLLLVSPSCTEGVFDSSNSKSYTRSQVNQCSLIL